MELREEARELGAGRGGLAVKLDGVDIHPVIKVRAVVAAGEGGAGADVAGMRVAEGFDQAVFVVALLVVRVLGELLDRVLVAAEELGGLVGLVPHGHGVVHGLERAVLDLLEVSLAGGDLGRVNVEGHRALGQAERVHA